jgi:hypothetical protein
MKLRDRLNEAAELELRFNPSADSSSGPAPGSLNALRDAGQALLDAGDDAIDRVLSGNSETFLAASPQHSGQ